MNAILTYLASVNWAIWLGIAALVLMFPVALIANVTTPMIQDWWSTRSRKALERRITKLVEWQTTLRKSGPVDQNTADILEGIRQAMMLIYYAATMIVAMVGVAAKVAMVGVAGKRETAWGLSVTLGILMISGYFLYFATKVSKLKARVSPDYQDELEKRIERLRDKISRLDQREARRAVAR